MVSKAKIKAEVAKLLALPGGDVRPLPLERLVRARGIELSIAPLETSDDISGFYYREGHRRVIGVNSTHPTVRQRFTVAHELGHAVLHDAEGVHLDQAFKLRNATSSQAVDPEEIAANQFAAELLMPEAEVLDAVREDGLDLNDDEAVRKLARHFGVSQQSLLFRLVNLKVYIDGRASV